MQFNIFAVAALATLVSAQGFAGVPPCAAACVGHYLPTACNLDFQCICQNATFIADISCCVAGACDSTGQSSALGAASSICQGVNVVLPTAAGCSGSATAAYTTGPGSLASASSAATRSSSSGSSAATSSSSITSRASSSSASASSSAASSSASAASTSKAAGVKIAAQGLGLAGVVLGAAVML